MSVCSIELQSLFSVSHSTVCSALEKHLVSAAQGLNPYKRVPGMFFAKAVFQPADVWVTLVIYVSSSRQVSAENYAFCCSCQDMCCIRRRLFPTVLFSRSHDCHAVHFWEVSPCLKVPLNCTGWLFIANWSKRKRKNWLNIRPWNCVRTSAESGVFVSSSVFHSLNQRLLIWPLMTSRSVTSCVKVLRFINPPGSQDEQQLNTYVVYMNRWHKY